MRQPGADAASEPRGARGGGRAAFSLAARSGGGGAGAGGTRGRAIALVPLRAAKRRRAESRSDDLRNIVDPLEQILLFVGELEQLEQFQIFLAKRHPCVVLPLVADI